MSLPEPAASPVLPTPVAQRENPFKGLAYYERKDSGRFAGRQRDIEAVANGILRTRTFVLYGRSGLGKTSLLLAGVFPRLADQKCRTLDIRLLEDPLGDLRRALAGLAGPASEDTEGTEDLAALVERASRAQDGRDGLVVIAFDQFEEFFIRFSDQPDPAGGVRSGEELDRKIRQQRIAQREAFIQEIGRLAADVRLNLRLVFSLREDWIAEMQDFADAVPEIAQNMYRLLPLTSFGVRQTIVETLRTAGTEFDSRLISALVDTLAEVHFDPIVLQVLCSEVWDKARHRSREPEPVRLELGDLEAIGGVREVFRGYLDQVQGETEATDRRRRILTRAVLDALISEKRTKLALSHGDLLQQYFVITELELDEVLDRLYRHRLIRSDPRGKVRWYELVHERLIGAILEWFETDLDFFKFRSARNLLTSSCRNRGWRENPELLLNRGQLDDTVGPFKDLLRFSDEERLFLVSSAVYAHSRDLEFWADLAGDDISAELLGRFLDQADNERLRLRGAEAVGRVAERPAHFAGRCLDLALRDPSSKVRQAAARSFADLASPPEFQELAERLREKTHCKAALDVLTEVTDKDKLPTGVKLGRRRLWQARRKLYRRRLEMARKAVRQRSLRGALIGLVAALLWSVTAGVLLMRISLYEVLTNKDSMGLLPWTLASGMYLLVALALGVWVGWRTARRAATAALRRGREGLSFRTLAGGPVPLICGAVFLTWGAVWMARAGEIESDITNPGSLDVAGVAAAALLGCILWTALGVTRAVPAIWPRNIRRESSWIWAWIWAFGLSLILLPLVFPAAALNDASDSLGPSTSSRSAAVEFGVNSFNFFCFFMILFGGLFAYAGLLSAAFSLPGKDPRNELLGTFPKLPSHRARKINRGLGIALAGLGSGLLVYLFGWDGLPLLAPSRTLESEPIPVDVNPGPSGLNKTHVQLFAPKTALAPRLAGISLMPGLRLATAGVKFWREQVFIILRPGERRQVAFFGGQARVLIWPDRPLSGVLRPEEDHLVVARLSLRNGVWSGRIPGLENLRTRKHPLYLNLGHVIQGGDWCKNATLTVQVSGAGEGIDSLLSPPCEPKPEDVTFNHEISWNPQETAPELTARAWQSVDLAHGESTWAGFSPDGSRAATIFHSSSELEYYLEKPSAEANALRLWSLNGSGPPVIVSHPAPLKDFVFSPDGRWFATVSTDNVVRIWKVDGSGKPVLLPHQGEVTGITFSQDGTRIATSQEDLVRIWRVDGSGRPVELRHPSAVYFSVAFSPDGNRIATGDLSGTTRIWNVDGSGVSMELRWNDDASGDKTVDPSDPLSAIDQIRGLHFSPDGTRIVVAFGNGTAVIWNLDNSDEPVKILQHEKSVSGSIFNWTGTHILTVSEDGFARIWKADGAGPILLVPANKAAFSRDGRIATASEDGTVRIWKLDGSAEPIVLGHGVSIKRIQFSRDGSRLLTVPEIGAARIWNLSRALRPKQAGDLFLFLRVSSKPHLP